MADKDTKSKDEEVPMPADDATPEEPKEEPKAKQETKEPEAPEQEPVEEESPEPEQEIKAEEPEADKPPSRRESLRIQQLIEKLKQQPQTGETPKVQSGLDYTTVIEGEPELYKQLEADRQKAADSARQEGLKAAESIQFRTMLEIDAPKVESKYPQLDKESTEFNPAVANAINQWYLSTAGYSPGNRDQGIPETVQNATVRYAEFVEGIMELANEMAGEKTASSTKNIAKQAATTGLRPDGSRTKGLDLTKAPQNMTDEELKAVIAQSGL